MYIHVCTVKLQLLRSTVLESPRPTAGFANDKKPEETLRSGRERSLFSRYFDVTCVARCASAKSCVRFANRSALANRVESSRLAFLSRDRNGSRAGIRNCARLRNRGNSCRASPGIRCSPTLLASTLAPEFRAVRGATLVPTRAETRLLGCSVLREPPIAARRCIESEI